MDDASVFTVYSLYGHANACCGPFSCFVLFVSLLLCYVDPVQHCDHLVWELVTVHFLVCGLRTV